jgi:hypothetical protein
MLMSSVVYEYPHSPRTIVIGDIHGDLKRFKQILVDARIINENLEWIAEPPNTIVVQLGDQVDSANRAPEISDWEVLDDTQILHFTHSLTNIAKAKGGNVISLIGNHELMNVIGNFTYVSPKSNFPDRYKYFQPGGTLASSILANRPLVLKIGSLFFCHAGIMKSHIDVLEQSNKPVSYINDVWKQYVSTGTISIEDKDIFDKIILGPEGIVWTRSIDTDEDAEYVLNKIGCQCVFIGHTSVERVHIVKDRLFFVDTGISRAFGSTSFQYLDINGWSINVKTIEDVP